MRLKTKTIYHWRALVGYVVSLLMVSTITAFILLVMHVSGMIAGIIGASAGIILSLTYTRFIKCWHFEHR